MWMYKAALYQVRLLIHWGHYCLLRMVAAVQSLKLWPVILLSSIWEPLPDVARDWTWYNLHAKSMFCPLAMTEHWMRLLWVHLSQCGSGLSRDLQYAKHNITLFLQRGQCLVIPMGSHVASKPITQQGQGNSFATWNVTIVSPKWEAESHLLSKREFYWGHTAIPFCAWVAQTRFHHQIALSYSISAWMSSQHAKDSCLTRLWLGWLFSLSAHNAKQMWLGHRLGSQQEVMLLAPGWDLPDQFPS